MKLKDIEHKLRSEQETVKVPDMLSRVKKAPLNKLLSGETPAQAFKKKLAVRLLVTATVLLIAAVFCFAAMLLFTENGKANPHAYLSIKTSGEGESYAIFVTGDLSKAACFDERTGEQTSFYALSALYDLKSTDKVEICAICEDASLASDLLGKLREELSGAYAGFNGASVTTSVNSDSAIALLKQKVSAAGLSAESDLTKLIDQYYSVL